LTDASTAGSVQHRLWLRVLLRLTSPVLPQQGRAYWRQRAPKLVLLAKTQASRPARAQQ